MQRLRADSTNTAFPGEPISLEEDLGRPVDVVTDPSGESVFLSDIANNWVLRFLATGGFQDTVYSQSKTETAVDPPLSGVRYVAADDSLCFLPDSINNRIVVLRLATQ